MIWKKERFNDLGIVLSDPEKRTFKPVEEFLCHCRGGCALRFYFLKRWKKNEIHFWVGEVEALLQFLVCALACVNFKCAYICGLYVNFGIFQ